MVRNIYRIKRIVILTIGVVIWYGGIGWGADWYVGPGGTAGNAGSKEAPWDIVSALEGKQKVGAGDTVYLLEGVYKRRPREKYVIKLEGSENQPIHVRPAPEGRATIDGGLEIHAPSTYLWIWDLEILVSEPRPEKATSPGSHPEDLKRPWGGLNMHGGKHCKYINLVIHDTNQGISCWKGETDCEIYGCLIYDNGWLGTDRGHGHCIYTQNDQGIKTISNCIMSCLYDGTYSMHAYGSSRAYVNNYLATENIVYGKGPFLIGGGRSSEHIRVFRNYLYNASMRIGYSAPHNEDCEVRDNVIVNGNLEIKKYKRAVQENNLVLKKQDKKPGQAKVFLLQNKYDANRGHLAIYNFAKETEVAVDVGGFLKPGDGFRVMDPKDIFGQPVYKGKCNGKTITVPVKGEFAAYVVLKDVK